MRDIVTSSSWRELLLLCSYYSTMLAESTSVLQAYDPWSMRHSFHHKATRKSSALRGPVSNT
eukprot:6206807-Pleurochrysis_carterae.AAC.1